MSNHQNAGQLIHSSTASSLTDKPIVQPLPQIKAALALVSGVAAQSGVRLLAVQHPQRTVVEGFIKGIFKIHHQAQVSHFLPELFAVFNEQGQPQSALGIKCASQGHLYLEHYLNEPIENLLNNTLGQAIKRSDVVEIGNLASQNSASCKALFAHITQHLQEQNVKWITCTGTTTLRVVFKRLGIKALPIHKADQNRLGDEQYSWGNYYQNDPQVMLINVAKTNQHFKQLKKATEQKNLTH